MKKHFIQGKRNALLMGALTVLLCLVLGDGLLGMVSYRDDPTMRALVVLPGIAVFLVGLFLPPWLFRKTVHKRDTFWNLPLYFLAFFPLRSFFEDRVFLTQHFFLRPVMGGFISLPGEGLLAPVLAAALMWTAGWFALDMFSAAPEPVRRGETAAQAEAEQTPKKRHTKLDSSVAVIAFFLCCWAGLYLSNTFAGLIPDSRQLDREVTVQFDQDGVAYIDFSSGYSIGKTYSGFTIDYHSHSPSEASERVTVEFEVQERKDGPYTAYRGFTGQTEGAYVFLMKDNGRPVSFRIPDQYTGAAKNCRFVIRAKEEGLQEATFHIQGYF